MDLVQKPAPKVGKKKALRNDGIVGLSLPQSFTSSGDFVASDIAKESEKEMMYN